MDELEQQIQGVTHISWLTTLVMAVLIIGVTMVVAHIATKALRKLLEIGDDKGLPSSSIFVNIARVAIWFLGVCILMSSCFGVDVTAAVAALGVGGIAISLGFQDTISNLIGGLQVSLMRIVTPGDNIEVGASKGVVRDVTWRHTTIVTAIGEEIVIPNSIINKTALVHLAPANQSVVPVSVIVSGGKIDEAAREIEEAASKAIASVGPVEKDPTLLFTNVGDLAFHGSLIFRMEHAQDCSQAVDAAIRAIAPLTRDAEESAQ